MQTLDGVDFSKDEIMIAQIKAEVEQKKAAALQRAQGLATIPEEGKSQTSGAAATDGNRAAAGGAQRSYQFN